MVNGEMYQSHRQEKRGTVRDIVTIDAIIQILGDIGCVSFPGWRIVISPLMAK